MPWVGPGDPEAAPVAVPLRGHHLLCILGFRGAGYGSEFTAQLSRIVMRLAAEPRTPVRLVQGRDAICSAFPPDQPPHCEEPRVHARDQRVLAAIEEMPGAVLPWDELRRRVARALRPADLTGLCATCPWLPLGYCQEGLGGLRRTLPDDMPGNP